MMSFSVKVKRELSAVPRLGRHCGIAELSAILCACGRVEVGGGIISIQTENIFVSKRFFQIVKGEFGIKCGIMIKRNIKHGKNVIILYIEGCDAVKKIVSSTGIAVLSGGRVEKKIPPLVIRNDCCKISYLRGVFLCSGSISDPSRNNHLEIAANLEEYAYAVAGVFERLNLGFMPKITVRKGHNIVYFKDGEQISGVLSALGAYGAMMEYENGRILKDVNNKINRQVNFQNANMDKAMTAALEQINDILYIEEEKGLSSLPGSLEEIARARLLNPEMSLKEIGLLLNPPVGKSGVNHRLRKICKIAGELRNG